jgi:hypothetical protein
MARRKQAPTDLTGIRQRGGTYQVRVSAGYNPVTGRQLMLSGSADTEDAAILIRDRPHRTLDQAAPLQPLPSPALPSQLGVRRRDQLGGLIHEYSRVA